MSKRKRFISALSKIEIKKLKEAKKTGKSSIFRSRCHAILLSNKGFDTNEITKIFDVKILTVYNWFNRWEEGGIEGLKTKSGQGRKPLLSIDNKEHVKAVKKAVKKRAQTGENILLTVEKELDLEGQMSMDILRPFLKRLITFGSDLEEE
jgi:transposase